MNWFEDVFAALLPMSDAIGSIWWTVSLLWLGQAGAVALGVRRWTPRLAAAFATWGLWPVLVPSAPLAGFDGVVPDRVTSLQDDAILVLAMMALGAGMVVRQILGLRARRLDVTSFPVGVALLVMGGLAYTYHLVLMNGVDEAQRAAEARSLVRILDLDDSVRAQICSLPDHWCGQGMPRTGNPRFDSDLAVWFGRMAQTRDGIRAASSNGAVTSAPTYVWAARRDGAGVESIRWIAREYQSQTDALELGFRSLLGLATLFWAGAALAVEAAHRRAFRRRAPP